MIVEIFADRQSPDPTKPWDEKAWDETRGTKPGPANVINKRFLMACVEVTASFHL